MKSKKDENNIPNKTWESGIFTIPNDLFYSEDDNNNSENEFQIQLINNFIISDVLVSKTIFTNLLTPNWEKHISNYVRHKFSGYRKKIRRIYDSNNMIKYYSIINKNTY